MTRIPQVLTLQYKEGGQGYTKYTVYTKNKEGRVEEKRIEKMK